MSPGWRSDRAILVPKAARLPVHSLDPRSQAIETNPEQSWRYPSDQYAVMLYGTPEDTHFAARLMISSRVVVRCAAWDAEGSAGAPDGP
ncbi:hypothetical protein GA0115249_100221, partial [Streptomyces sp. PpalLS-921]